MGYSQSSITVADATRVGVSRFLVYCTNCAKPCSHCGEIPADVLAPELRIKTLESRLRCTVCGRLGGSIRPDYGFWTKGVRPPRQ
jgi:hypothetical protein